MVPSSASDILRSAATLAVNDALQAAMFLPEPKELPDLRTTALDEILAVGIRRLVMMLRLPPN
jgi:hypothetical protein